MSLEDVTSASATIIARLKLLPQTHAAQTVHTFVAWRNEVNNHQLIRDLLAEDKRVVIPVIDLPGHKLTHSLITKFEDLQAGPFGILQPAPDEIRQIEIAEIDLILVPGVAFDRSGNRIGLGGGYYDDFLRQTHAVKIALCYQFQIVEAVPTRPEDEPVDLLVTEKATYEIG
jgi:5-formyltetrahydrofolate cyclo-ligase